MIPLRVAIALSRAEQLAPGCKAVVADTPDVPPGYRGWHIVVRDVRPEYAPALIAGGFSPMYSHAANGMLTLDRSLAAHYAGAAAWHLHLTG